MKQKPGTVILLFFLMVHSRSFSQHAANAVVSTKIQEAIKQVIADETEAFINGDSIRLFSFYADEEITQTVWNQPDGDYVLLKGKNKIRENFAEALQKKPNRNVLPTVERLNWLFKELSSEYVWVNFNQKLRSKNGTIEESYETRLMKKETSGWKTVVVIALNGRTR